jgi:uncharacterized protein (DUF2237 family)
MFDDPERNVFGEPLQVCSHAPLTGFRRKGACESGPQDLGPTRYAPR